MPQPERTAELAQDRARKEQLIRVHLEVQDVIVRANTRRAAANRRTADWLPDHFGLLAFSVVQSNNASVDKLQKAINVDPTLLLTVFSMLFQMGYASALAERQIGPDETTPPEEEPMVAYDPISEGPAPRGETPAVPEGD